MEKPRIYKILPFLVVFVIAYSCSTVTDPADNADYEQADKVDSVNMLDDFMPFYERFRQEPAFQEQQVRFPYTIEIWDYETDRAEKQTLYKDDWQYLDLYHDSTFVRRKADAYKQEIKLFGDTVKIQQRGIDNGIAIDYIFLKINGQWQLVGEKDFSN